MIIIIIIILVFSKGRVIQNCKVLWRMICNGSVAVSLRCYVGIWQKRQRKIIHIISLSLSIKLGPETAEVRGKCGLIFTCGEMPHYGGVETFYGKGKGYPRTDHKGPEGG
jgi:hypothetical protein